MFYCEKCKLLNNDATCNNCGKSHLPTAQPNDICFVTQLYIMYATMYEEALKAKNIPVFSVPCGFSLNTRASEDRNIYVPYEFYDNAIEIYEDIFSYDDESNDPENSNQTDCADDEININEIDDN